MQKAKKYVMALDQGTTSSRCILFDRSGKVCSVAQKEFAQYYPQPGWVEHNPMEIWSSQLSVAVEAMGQIGAEEDDTGRRPDEPDMFWLQLSLEAKREIYREYSASLPSEKPHGRI